MNKKKPLFRRLLPWLITAAVLAVLIIFVFVPIYSVKEDIDREEPEYFAYSGDGKEMTMENDKLLFAFDPLTTQFTVTDKATNHIWRSNPEDVDSDPIALKAEKERMKSTLVVSYSTTDGVVTHFNNFTYSVENGVYDVVRLDDGSIKVNYTIGKVNKTFYVPYAVTEERMNELIDSMSKSDKRKVTDSYRLYNPEKYKASDDVAALEAMYPGLAEGKKMYILRNGVADHVKLKLQTYFQSVNYTTEDYYKDLENIADTGAANAAVFNASIIYRLEGDDLVVEVPYDEIRYFPDFPITYLAVLPAFGATSTADQGYMIVPDGGGAIINYNNGKIAQNNYYANMYGWDWGSERRQAVNETRCTFPLYAMTDGDDSFLCILEGNSSYAGILADISGRANINSYNTCYARYTVLHSDQYDVSAKSNNRVYIYEEQVSGGNIVQRYRFLNTNNYAEMASSYGDYLANRYPSLTPNENPDLPVSVEVLGAIDKMLQQAGLPQQVEVPMTTFDQGAEMMDSLLESGIRNLKLIYTGWANGGLQQQVLTGVHTVNALGGENGLRQIIAKAKDKGVDLYLDGAVEFAYDSDFFDGFIAFRDAAKYTTRDRIELYPYSTIWYTPMKWRDASYLVKPSYMQMCAKNLLNKLDELGVEGVMFRDVGSILSADYNPKDFVSREESKQIQLGIMADAEAKDLKVATKLGMDYALTNADLVTEMDLMGGAYSIIDVSVPFYQIALHGRLEYTGSPINLAGDYRTQLLKAAEYGAGLNFSLMAEKAQVLQNSFYSGYFASSYGEWGDLAIQLANEYQSAMSGLGNQKIVGHERIAEKVAVTRYENGTSVYVNYGDAPYSADGVTVPARSYTVKGGR